MKCARCGVEIVPPAVTCPACADAPAVTVASAMPTQGPAARLVAQAPIPDPTAKQPPAPFVVLLRGIWNDIRMTAKLMSADPYTGLAKANEKLTAAEALYVAITLIVISDLFMCFAINRLPPGALAPGFFKPFFLLAIPPLSLACAVLAVRKFMKSVGRFSTDLLIASVAMAPLGAAALIGGLVGMANAEVIGVLLFVGVCVMALQLHEAFLLIVKLTERQAFFATPLALIACAYIMKVVYCAIMTN